MSRLEYSAALLREARQEAVRAAADAAVEARDAAGPNLPNSACGSSVQAAVRVGGAHVVEVARHAADRRRVGAAVVVDDDDEVAVVVVGDVVERFPRHAAGERAVADDGDDVAVLCARSA